MNKNKLIIRVDTGIPTDDTVFTKILAFEREIEFIPSPKLYILEPIEGEIDWVKYGNGIYTAMMSEHLTENEFDDELTEEQIIKKHSDKGWVKIEDDGIKTTRNTDN